MKSKSARFLVAAFTMTLLATCHPETSYALQDSSGIDAPQASLPLECSSAFGTNTSATANLAEPRFGLSHFRGWVIDRNRIGWNITDIYPLNPVVKVSGAWRLTDKTTGFSAGTYYFHTRTGEITFHGIKNHQLLAIMTATLTYKNGQVESNFADPPSMSWTVP